MRLIKFIIIILLFASCHVQQRIEQAKIDAVKMNRLENPCINDTILRLVPGEIFTQHDTTTNIWHDSIYNWTYDTIRITKTIKKTDTVKLTVKDLYLINSLNDSINVRKRIESKYLGQLQEKTKELSLEKKQGRKWMVYFILMIALLIAYFGVLFYLSLKFPK
jgi:hypothetical protein